MLRVLPTREVPVVPVVMPVLCPVLCSAVALPVVRALFVVTPVLGPVLSLSASSVFSGPLTLVLSSPLPDLPPATSPRESELPSPASLCWPVATITVPDFELPFPLLSPLLELALALAELAGAGLLDLAAGSAGFAGALLEALGAGAAVGAGWLLEPPFALFLLPSPLPPIWWSLL